jgi:hypothetical protein
MPGKMRWGAVSTGAQGLTQWFNKWAGIHNILPPFKVPPLQEDL